MGSTVHDGLLTERSWMALVVQLAQLRGWRCFHTHDSRRSAAGFPDLVLVRADRLLVAELKTAHARTTIAQDRWLAALGDVPCVEVHVWRPSDFEEVRDALA